MLQPGSKWYATVVIHRLCSVSVIAADHVSADHRARRNGGIARPSPKFSVAPAHPSLTLRHLQDEHAGMSPG